MPPEGQMMVPREGHGQGDQPADHVGRQRSPGPQLDETDHGQPMHRGGRTTDHDKPRDAGNAADHGVASTVSGRMAATGGGATICLCADDFGLHEGVNAAVRHLTGMGRVHAVGALVGAPAWRSGIGTLRRIHAEGLDVGLHLDLTEHPVTPGLRRGLGHLIAHAYLGRLERSAIRAEIRAQLDAFESGVGHGPSYVDGHQHVHQLPVVRDELMAELDDRYGGFPPWIRSTRSRFGSNYSAGIGPLWKSAMIELLGAHSLAEAAHRYRVQQNHTLLGVYDFAGGAPRFWQLLKAWLRASHDGDLLMCHPGRAIPKGDPLASAREAEYQVLASPAFAQLVRDLGVMLWPMSQILADPI